MRIITCGDARFDSMKKLQKVAVEALGYDHTSYDLEDLEIVKDLQEFVAMPCAPEDSRQYFPRCPWKPWIIKEAMQQNPGEIVVWMDTDAFPIRTFDEILRDDKWGMAVTIRPHEEKGSQYTANPEWAGYVNAGVMFFRPRPTAYQLLDLWLDTTLQQGNGDQAAITSLLLQMGSVLPGAQLHRGEAVVNCLPTWEYNNYYIEDPARYPHQFDKKIEDIKIIHCKGADSKNSRHGKLYKQYVLK